jgi:asparagine synthetase B (glutamine-hydrolysing)
MCGLDVVIDLNYPVSGIEALRSSSDDRADPSEAGIVHRRSMISRRGPDINNSLKITGEWWTIDLFGCVLHIQGSVCQSQPIEHPYSQSHLLWNGESLNHQFGESSDTAIVIDMLTKDRDVVNSLHSIEGPFAFVWVDVVSKRVWFGKDRFGRRSLLMRVSLDGKQVVLASSGLVDGVELPAGEGIFSLDLVTSVVSAHRWPVAPVFKQPSFLSGTDVPSLEELHARLLGGIRRHMQSVSVNSALGILFSGGLDSCILASIAAEAWGSMDHNLTRIDLINVASSGETSSPDRATGLVSFVDLLEKFPGVPFRFICVDIVSNQLCEAEPQILSLSAPNDTLMDFNISGALWFGGRAKGRVLDASFREDPEWRLLREQIVARESLESAAENRRPKKGVPIVTVDVPCSKCGKRKSKPGCIAIACKICCKDGTCPAHIPWKSESVHDAIVDVDSFVDKYTRSSDVVQSDCRILLVGHGADELFGGYGRHETKSSKGGLEALRTEILLDIGRLWQRNLGRDDRVLADSARDVRHPFLDDSILEFVGGLSISELVSNNGENKPILRRLAREVLGMQSAASFRKRAIQFGTRIAQRTNIAVFGSHSKGSGTTVYRPLS